MSTSEPTIKLWYQYFKDGRQHVESESCSGRLFTIRPPKFKLAMRGLENIKVLRTIVLDILTEVLDMSSVAEFVPQLKEFRVKIAQAHSSHLVQGFLLIHKIPQVCQSFIPQI